MSAHITGFKKQAEKASLNSESPVAGCAVPRMAWVTTLLVLVACWAGSSYQFTLTQPLSMSVTPGETAQLACVPSSGESISSRYIRWYQQKQGEKPRYLLYYKDDSTQGKGSGVPDRFTASKDTSRNTCFLTISRAQVEDEADYYCLDWDGTSKQHTVIQLHGEEEQKPLSPAVTQHREPTCVSLVPMRWPGGLAPGAVLQLWGFKRESEGSWKRDVILWIPTMAWAPLLLTLLTYCIGFSSQQLQSLKASEFVSPGGTVTLSCSLSSGALTDNNYPLWVQHRLGNVPRLIMHHTSTRPSGIPERFTGSRSGNTMSLTIKGALAEDDADYYCCVWTGSAHHSDTVRWGSDTKTSLPPVPCWEPWWLQSPGYK
ncbi:uncharacterized protein LOC112061364 [Chrysemys picta bellii]|uniref:uncharacterized protein LOC112061364 n=1 Tax=Chrysemys picta bellii TaxID=8478 RepID=UPI0032B0FC89